MMDTSCLLPSKIPSGSSSAFPDSFKFLCHILQLHPDILNNLFTWNYAPVFKQVNKPIVDVSGVSESVEPSLVPKDTVGQLQRSTSSVAALREPEHLLYVYVLTF